jgi:tetratricopeptide (TPR) repeat protein
MVRRFFLGCMLAFALAGCQTLPEFIDSTMKDGQALYTQKKYDEAIARFNEALRRDPRHFPAHVWTARAQIAQGAWGAAVASARKAWALAPRSADVVPVLAEALFGAGNAALKAGKFAQSIPLFLEYIELQPGNPAAYVNVARAYLGEKRFADALASLSRALGIPSDGATQKEALDLLLEGARRALIEGDLGSMIRFLSEYLKIDPANVRAWLDLARIYIKTGNYDGAASAYGQALRQSIGAERTTLLHEFLDTGKQALSSGRGREAAALLREYVSHDSGSVEAFLYLARAFWSAGDRMQAMDAFRRVVELNPRQREALRFMLGQ